MPRVSDKPYQSLVRVCKECGSSVEWKVVLPKVSRRCPCGWREYEANQKELFDAWVNTQLAMSWTHTASTSINDLGDSIIFHGELPFVRKVQEALDGGELPLLHQFGPDSVVGWKVCLELRGSHTSAIRSFLCFI
jgi:hypothetical protein